jgi:cation transport ATPase
MIKSKTFVNSRSSHRDSENVETKSNSFRFVVDSKSLIIFASFVTFTSTSFINVVWISFVTLIFAFFVTLFSVSAFLDESIVNSTFEEMNRDVLIRLFTTLISFFVDFANVFITNSTSIQSTIFVIDFFVTFVFEFIIEIDFENWTTYSLENRNVDKIWS